MKCKQITKVVVKFFKRTIETELTFSSIVGTELSLFCRFNQLLCGIHEISRAKPLLPNHLFTCFFFIFFQSTTIDSRLSII